MKDINIEHWWNFGANLASKTNKMEYVDDGNQLQYTRSNIDQKTENDRVDFMKTRDDRKQTVTEIYTNKNGLETPIARIELYDSGISN